MRTSVVCIESSDRCGIDESFFYKYGVEIDLFIKTANVLDNIRAALKSAFSSSDGMCVVYSAQSWPNIQKAMLMEFERSSVFVDGLKPYVIAKGFKEIEKNIFFDMVYGKPILMMPGEIKENLLLGNVFETLSSNIKRIGVFSLQIKSKHALYVDEVETVLLAKPGEVDELTESIDKHCIYTMKGETPQESLYKVLANKDATMVAAESCTGGLVSAYMADVPGVSGYLKGGCVTYSNELKNRFLGVNMETLNSVGAVSQEVAKQMAIGALNNTMSDFAVSVTGIAGPGGATRQKKVGLVYFAAASHNNIEIRQMNFTGNRRLIRHKSAKYAILFLRDFILRQ
jgi:nicotinamide-nucleotide amidase